MDNNIGESAEFFITVDGEQQKLEIPEHGMLGLLAYGDIGLRAWRQTRQAEIDKRAAEARAKLFVLGEDESDE
jgi:hypothetical protein